MILKELLESSKAILHAAGILCFETDAERLLCFVLGIDRALLFLNRSAEIDGANCARCLNLASRVAAGEPLQYVTGEAYFMGHRFAVDPSVLIPRPETEVLCDLAIRHLRMLGGTPSVLDLCTGSGALAISIALAVPAAQLTASDISPEALALAGKNAQTLGALAQIDFCKSDLFGDLSLGDLGDLGGLPLLEKNAGRRPYDLIVTNPPYVRTGDLAGLPREVRCHEPTLALDGGVDGLEFYRRIATGAGRFLADGGRLLAEIGCDQGAQVKAAFTAAGFLAVSVLKDLAGRDRIVRAVKP